MNLLLASDSPAAFVRSCLVEKRNAELGVADLYSPVSELVPFEPCQTVCIEGVQPSCQG